MSTINKEWEERADLQEKNLPRFIAKKTKLFYLASKVLSRNNSKVTIK